MHSIPFRQLGIDVDGDCHGTEGPWVFDARRMIVTSTLPRTGMRPAGDHSPTGCRLPASYTPQVVDGYLLAAAPDLLKALEKCVRILVDDFDYRPDDEAANEWADIRAAIKKARGES